MQHADFGQSPSACKHILQRTTLAQTMWPGRGVSPAPVCLPPVGRAFFVRCTTCIERCTLSARSLERGTPAGCDCQVSPVLQCTRHNSHRTQPFLRFLTRSRSDNFVGNAAILRRRGPSITSLQVSHAPSGVRWATHRLYRIQSSFSVVSLFHFTHSALHTTLLTKIQHSASRKT